MQTQGAEYYASRNMHSHGNIALRPVPAPKARSSHVSSSGSPDWMYTPVNWNNSLPKQGFPEEPLAYFQDSLSDGASPEASFDMGYAMSRQNTASGITDGFAHFTMDATQNTSAGVSPTFGPNDAANMVDSGPITMDYHTAGIGAWQDQAMMSPELYDLDTHWATHSLPGSFPHAGTQWPESPASTFEVVGGAPFPVEMTAGGPSQPMTATSAGVMVVDPVAVNSMPYLGQSGVSSHVYSTQEWDSCAMASSPDSSQASHLPTQEGPSYSLPRPTIPAGRWLSNESDPGSARSDPRYKVSAGPDGLYHCPDRGCKHKPDKLKCNYQ